MDERADKWRLAAMADEFPSAKVSNSWPQPPDSFLSKDSNDYWNHCRKYKKGSAPKVRDNTSKAKAKDRYSITSSNRVTRMTSPGHDHISLPTKKAIAPKNFLSCLKQRRKNAAGSSNRKAALLANGWLPYLSHCKLLYTLHRNGVEFYFQYGEEDQVADESAYLWSL